HASLGLPISQVYAESWEQSRAYFEGPWQTGRAAVVENTRFLIHRKVPLQELFVDVSYVPVLDENGDTAGIHLVLLEKTESVVGPRRTRILQACSQDAAN